jgi:hypothetical protein
MTDVPTDLGQRILLAARLAVVVHFQQTALEQGERSGRKCLHQQNCKIGGADPSACGGRCADVPDASKEGRLPNRGARWSEGEAA